MLLDLSLRVAWWMLAWQGATRDRWSLPVLRQRLQPFLNKPFRTVFFTADMLPARVFARKPRHRAAILW